MAAPGEGGGMSPPWSFLSGGCCLSYPGGKMLGAGLCRPASAGLATLEGKSTIGAPDPSGGSSPPHGSRSAKGHPRGGRCRLRPMAGLGGHCAGGTGARGRIGARGARGRRCSAAVGGGVGLGGVRAVPHAGVPWVGPAPHARHRAARATPPAPKGSTSGAGSFRSPKFRLRGVRRQPLHTLCSAPLPLQGTSTQQTKSSRGEGKCHVDEEQRG